MNLYLGNLFGNLFLGTCCWVAWEPVAGNLAWERAWDLTCEPVLGNLVWAPVPGNLWLGTLLGNLFLGTLLVNLA